jgi:diguanylate cyclase (GGDEF)-like protein
MPRVVSLKPFLDSPERQLIAALVDSYQRLLAATAESNASLCAQSAGELAPTLRLLEQSISEHSRPTEIVSAQQTAERELAAWQGRTQDYLRQKAAEMKDLMMLIARTAESVAERDQRHNRNLQGLTERLKSIAELEDISRLRSSLVASVEEISRTVQQMSRDTEQTRRALEEQLSQYRERLEKTEHAAHIDALTGLANRRRIETDLAARIRLGQPFAAILMDLNGFKQINDTHGHLAGDQLLRHFASELRQVCHQSDLVGRWGGDEFLILTAGAQAQADNLRQRIEQWVWGSYPLKPQPGQPAVKVDVRAAIGIALWQPGLDAAQLLAAADQAMYQAKALARRAASAG